MNIIGLLKQNEWSRLSPSLRSKDHPRMPAATCPICCLTKARGVHDPECWLGQAITALTKEPGRVKELKSELEGKEDAWHEAMYQLKQRVVTSLGWMVIALKYQYDLTCGNLEEGNQGGYSKELTEAMELLEELKGDIT